MKYYSDYTWKEGTPCGVGLTEASAPSSYLVVSDPYRKHLSLERYENGAFVEVVYDSALLDFRKLTPVHQVAWRKEDLGGDVFLIRDQNDRVVYREVSVFEGERCRSCRVETPFGYLLSTHRMYYQALGDAFDGVALFDRKGRPVMVKRYAVDEATGAFTELQEEFWENIPTDWISTASADRS